MVGGDGFVVRGGQDRKLPGTSAAEHLWMKAHPEVHGVEDDEVPLAALENTIKWTYTPFPATRPRRPKVLGYICQAPGRVVSGVGPTPAIGPNRGPGTHPKKTSPKMYLLPAVCLCDG